jgi:hypothetical protein
MRKITKQVSDAFMNGYDYTNDNTKVLASGNGKNTSMYLHDNLIALNNDGKISITNSGWFSNVTKERLNGIPGVSIEQIKGIWILNGNTWDGFWIAI